MLIPYLPHQMPGVSMFRSWMRYRLYLNWILNYLPDFLLEPMEWKRLRTSPLFIPRSTNSIELLLGTKELVEEQKPANIASTCNCPYPGIRAPLASDSSLIYFFLT